MATQPPEKMNEDVRITEHKDGSVTIHNPKGRHSAAVTALLQSDDVLREKVGGFASFLREYAVVGLAIGFIVGQQANAVMKQLVASFVDPFAIVWFGQSLSNRTATLHHGTSPVKIPWGQFVFTLIDFFLVLIVVYAIIKLFRLDKFKKIDEAKKPKK